MAHPPDHAFTRAVGEAIGQLRRQAWSTRRIADQFGVTDSTITRWENGDRSPNLDQVSALDELLGHTRGYILRLAGYVSDNLDLAVAIQTASELDEDGREVLLNVYRFAAARVLGNGDQDDAYANEALAERLQRDRDVRGALSSHERNVDAVGPEEDTPQAG